MQIFYFIFITESKAEEVVEKVEPVIEPNKPNYVYVNTAEEDSMVVHLVLAWRKGKRELIPDPPPKPVEEEKKEEPETADAEKESDEPKTEGEDKPIEASESDDKKEGEESKAEKADENQAEKAEVEVDDEKNVEEKEEPKAESEPTDEVEKKDEPESEKVETEEEKSSEEEQPMETDESEAKPEAEEIKMECDDVTKPEEIAEESAKAEADEQEPSEKTEEQPMETEQTEIKDEVKTESEIKAEVETEIKAEAEDDSEPKADAEKEKEIKSETETETDGEAKTDGESKEDESKVETATDENAANEEKKEGDDTKSEDSDKPEPVYIEVDEYYVKYRNFSYLHCEWRTEEELLKGDRRVGPKIRRFEMKKAQQLNIFENLEDEHFNPDFVETDRVLDMSVHEDPATGKKTRHFLVKWKSLPYEDATWEIEDDVEEKKIEEYLRFNKLPPKDKWKPKRRPSPDMWRKLDKSPIYKNNNTLRPYQLEGLNWLSFSWYNTHNCILADEMGLGKTVS